MTGKGIVLVNIFLLLILLARIVYLNHGESEPGHGTSLIPSEDFPTTNTFTKRSVSGNIHKFQGPSSSQAASSGFQVLSNAETIFISRRLLSNASNMTEDNSTDALITLTLAEKASFTLGYTLSFLFGVTGNLLILIAIKTSKDLHNDLNYLLCNAALADILRMLTMTSYELFIIHAIGNGRGYIPALPGPSGDILCKAMWCLPDFSLYIFVFTLVSMTFERFVAVVFPFRAGILQGKSKWFIAGVWTAAILLSLPLLYATKSMKDGSKYICETDFTPLSSNSEASQVNAYKTVITVNAYVAFVIPILIILILNGAMAYTILTPASTTSSQLPKSSSNSKRDVIVMLGTVSVIFALTSLPIQVYLFSYIYASKWLHRSLPVYFTFLLFFVSELSCMVNPWVYPIFVKRFRRRYLKVLAKCFWTKRNRHRVCSDASTSSKRRFRSDETQETQTALSKETQF